MTHAKRPGDILADRYRLVDLLSERDGGLFWRAEDKVLNRHVAVHLLPHDDPRAAMMQAAARRSVTVVDPRILQVLDADDDDVWCYVVNEWGEGESLDLQLVREPLEPSRAAWVVAQVADTIARGHALGVSHGRLNPENVLIDHNGSVKIIGFAVDAALHGLPPGRTSTDVIDLVGLLYAALTGRWAGSSMSGLSPAPLSHGVPLRPRKVRAGIPRELDAICEGVLNPFGHGGHAAALDSAADVGQALASFLGDPHAGDAATSLAPPAQGGAHAGGLAGGFMGGMPGVPATRDRSTSSTPTPSLPESAKAAADAPPAPPVVPPPPAEPAAPQARTSPATAPSDAAVDPDATVAGMPVFDDDWTTPRTDAPPPPELAEPEPKPLFAPDPQRRPRYPVDQPPAPHVEPPLPIFDTSGSGSIPRQEAEEVPGRSWMRLAALVAVAALLLVAIGFAITLNSRSGEESTPSSLGPDDATTDVLRPVRVVKVMDFDPQGDTGEENPEEVGYLLDRDPATSWYTLTYNEQFGPGGLKDGVGVVLDLGSSQQVGQVELELVGSPTTARMFVSDTPPSAAPSGRPAASATVSGAEMTLRPAETATGRYVLVWFTALPFVGDGYRAEVSGVVVRS